MTETQVNLGRKINYVDEESGQKIEIVFVNHKLLRRIGRNQAFDSYSTIGRSLIRARHILAEISSACSNSHEYKRLKVAELKHRRIQRIADRIQKDAQAVGRVFPRDEAEDLAREQVEQSMQPKPRCY